MHIISSPREGFSISTDDSNIIKCHEVVVRRPLCTLHLVEISQFNEVYKNMFLKKKIKRIPLDKNLF